MAVDLYRFANNKFSQYGEDGIIEKLCEILQISNGYFCEFGAWDGKHLSNCYSLFLNGWGGCFIEGNPEKFHVLKQNFQNEDKITAINAFVTPSGKNRLDKLLQDHGIDDVDLLSIDIDGDDLHIWNGIREYRPKIVLIEYNPTIPTDTFFENPPGRNVGNAPLSILSSFRERDYTLAEGTDNNLIFVRADLARRHGIEEKPLLQIVQQLSERPPRCFFGYDGSLMVVDTNRTFKEAGCRELFKTPWRNYLCSQPIPRIFRGYGQKLYWSRFGVAISILRNSVVHPIETFRFLNFLRKEKGTLKTIKSHFR